MRKIKKTLLTCLIAIFAFTLCLGTGLLVKTNTAKADAVSVTFVSAGFDGGADIHETYGNPIRINTTELAWATSHNWVSASDWASISDYVTINGRTVTEINNQTTSTQKITLMMQGAGTFSFLRCYVPSDVMAIADVKSVGILEGWSFTDDQNGNVVYTASAVSFFRTGDTLLTKSDYDAQVTSKTKVLASDITISDATLTKPDDSYVVNVDMGVDMSGINYEVMGDGCINIRNAIYINGKSINEWNNQLIAEDSRFSDTATYCQFPQNSTTEGHEKFHRPVAIYGTSTGFTIRIFQELVADCETVTVTVGEGCYYSSFMVLENASKTVLTQNVVDITDKLTFLDNSHNNPADWGPTKLYFINTDNETCWTEAPWGGCLNESDTSGANGGQVQMKYIYFNGTSLWEINKTDDGSYSSTQGNIASGGIYAPILVTMSSELGSSIKLHVPDAYTNGKSGHEEIIIKKGFNVVEGGTSYVVTSDVIFTNTGSGWVKEIKNEEVATEITAVNVSGTDGDNFTFLTLSVHDYPESADNYGGTAVGVKDFINEANFYSKILIDDSPLASRSEALINVWGNKGVFAFRTNTGLAATKITILAGCKFPSYAMLADGTRKCFVTTEDVTFVKSGDTWAVEVETPFDLETYKAEKIAEITAYKQGEVDESERLEYVSSGTELIADSETKEEVDEYVALVKEMIDELPVVVSHTVTFKHEDGSVISSTKVEENATVSAPTAPAKNGGSMFTEFRFDGWFLDGVEFDFATVITEDIILVAKYTEVAKQATEIETSVVLAKPYYGDGVGEDYFINFELSVNDYEGRNTFGGTAITASEFLKQSNFTQKVLVNDAAYPIKGESYINVWRCENVFSTRCDSKIDDDNYEGFHPATLITKITVLAGCQFPTAEMLETGVLKYYVTTEDITFVIKNGVWMEESEALKKHVSFVHEDGTIISEQTLETAGTIARPADPVKTSIFNTYTFDGWYVGDAEFNFDTVIEDDLTIVAKFTAHAKAITEIVSTVNVISLPTNREDTPNDFFVVFGVANSDYLDAPGTYPSGNAVYVYSAREFVEQSNFYSHVLVNGVAIKERGEVYLNVWSNKGLSFRATDDAKVDGQANVANITSIKILAGCQIPTYKALSTGELEVLVVLDDVTFTLVDGNWVREEFRVNGAPIELDGYKAGAFRAEEEASRLEIVALAKEEIATATTAQEIEAIVSEAKALIDALKTNLDYVNEELAPLKSAATEEVRNHRAEDAIYDVQKDLRDAAVAEGLEAIASAISEEEVVNAVADAKMAIDAIMNKYQVTEVSMLATIVNCYAPGGNVNLHVTVPGLDLPATENGQIWYSTDDIDKAYLEELMDSFGLFDKILIGDNTLREWGFTSFFTDNQGVADGPNYLVGFNMGVPYPSVYFQLHTDSQEFKDEFAVGNINLDQSGSMTAVTIKEGLIIPGNAFLTGQDQSDIYIANAQSVSAGNALRNFCFESVVYTDVDSVKYVQGFDGTCGYFGVSLVGDDYANADDNEETVTISNIGINLAGIEVNGVANGYADDGSEIIVVNSYGLYNLGEAGKGYYSFQIFESEDDVHTVTIPAGTVFPTYAINQMAKCNVSGENAILVYFVYETTQDVTFVKTADGNWARIDEYRAQVTAQLDTEHSAKDGEYFASDVTAMAEAVATAKTAIANATTGEEIEEAYATAMAVLDAVLPKTETIATAKAELNAYKAEEGLFLEAEKAQRDTAVATAISAIDAAQTKEEIETAVATAKATIDALKTAETYAKEAIAEDVAAAKAELNAYKAEEGLYREEETAARLTIVGAAIAGLDEALDLETVNEIVAAAKAEIDALKTDAEYDAEEALAAKKEEGLDAINELKGNVDPDKYTDREMATINQLYNTAKSAINDATTLEAVDSAVATFTEELNKVPQIGQGGESSSETSGGDKPSGGCGGAIGGAGAMLTVLMLAGAMLLKKKND